MAPKRVSTFRSRKQPVKNTNQNIIVNEEEKKFDGDFEQYKFIQDSTRDIINVADEQPLEQNIEEFLGVPFTDREKQQNVVRARCLFVTYANADHLLFSDIKDFWLSRYESSGLRYFISEELHKSGVRHYHCYFCVDAGKDIKGKISTSFDIKKQDKNFHPNIRKGKMAEEINMIKYCMKDERDIYQTNIDDKIIATARALVGKKIVCENDELNYHIAIRQAESGNVQGALDHLKDHHPANYLIHGEKFERNLKKLAVPESEPKHDFSTFDVPEAIKKYMTLFAYSRSLILHGASNAGKTYFAEAMLHELAKKKGKKRVIVIRGGERFDKLKTMDNDVGGILFDDMCFSSLKHEEILHLIDVKNGGDVNTRFVESSIPPEIPRVFTSNKTLLSEIFNIGIGASEDAFKRRVCSYFVKPGEKLYYQKDDEFTQIEINLNNLPLKYEKLYQDKLHEDFNEHHIRQGEIASYFGSEKLQQLFHEDLQIDSGKASSILTHDDFSVSLDHDKIQALFESEDDDETKKIEELKEEVNNNNNIDEFNFFTSLDKDDEDELDRLLQDQEHIEEIKKEEERKLTENLPRFVNAHTELMNRKRKERPVQDNSGETTPCRESTFGEWNYHAPPPPKKIPRIEKETPQKNTMKKYVFKKNKNKK